MRLQIIEEAEEYKQAFYEKRKLNVETNKVQNREKEKVKAFSAHAAVVNDLSFDIEGEYIGSCSDDGSVVINSLFTDGSHIPLCFLMSGKWNEQKHAAWDLLARV